MTCTLCYENAPPNKKKIYSYRCPYCNVLTCYNCFYIWVQDNNHCYNCKTEYTASVLSENINTSWVITKYKKILFDRFVEKTKLIFPQIIEDINRIAAEKELKLKISKFNAQLKQRRYYEEAMRKDRCFFINMLGEETYSYMITKIKESVQKN